MITAGMIAKTEIYPDTGVDDCHPNYNEKTPPRTEVRYEQGGFSYVYLACAKVSIIC